MSQTNNKNNNPSDLGPWNLSENTKVLPLELTINQNLSNFINNNVSPRLTIRLPRIGHHLNNTSRSNKLTLKMSHQSLQFVQKQEYKGQHKTRYGVMNGSFKQSHTDKNRTQRKSQNLLLNQEGELTRRVSTILVKPIDSQVTRKKQQQKTHCLLNVQSSKKRSLYGLITELKSSSELMQLYLSQRKRN